MWCRVGGWNISDVSGNVAASFIRMSVFHGASPHMYVSSTKNKSFLSWFQTFAVFWILSEQGRWPDSEQRLEASFTHTQKKNVTTIQYTIIWPRPDTLLLHLPFPHLLTHSEPPTTWCPLAIGPANSSKPRPRYKYHVLLSLFILHTLHPALEDGTDRVFRNVGKPQSDAGEIPKRIQTKVVLPSKWRLLRLVNAN